jgi:hypothetical protein
MKQVHTHFATLPSHLPALEALRDGVRMLASIWSKLMSFDVHTSETVTVPNFNRLGTRSANQVGKYQHQRTLVDVVQ